MRPDYDPPGQGLPPPPKPKLQPEAHEWRSYGGLSFSKPSPKTVTSPNDINDYLDGFCLKLRAPDRRLVLAFLFTLAIGIASAALSQ